MASVTTAATHAVSPHSVLCSTAISSPPFAFFPAQSLPYDHDHHHRHHRVQCKAFKVEIEHRGVVTTLQVEEDEPVLEKAIDAGLDVPYDCRLGVCMTCPAKLVSGIVDQSGGMLSDDVVEKGYALLCVANPKSDCRFRVIPEEELLALQLVTAQH